MNHNKILKLIETIRHSFIGSHEVYTSGSCYQFYLILKELYPEAIPYYNIIQGHIITKIGDKYYDILGEAGLEENAIKFDDELDMNYDKHAHWINNPFNIYKIKKL